jgi:hypothetical protein
MSPTQKEKLFAALNIAVLCLKKKSVDTLCMRSFILLLGVTKIGKEINSLWRNWEYRTSFWKYNKIIENGYNT